MVLFAGFWPPRGLLSGSWPALAKSDAWAPTDRISSDSLGSSWGKSPHSRSFKYKARYGHSSKALINSAVKSSQLIQACRATMLYRTTDLRSARGK